MYRRFKDENVKLNKNMVLVMLWYVLIIPTGILLLLSAFIFYENDFAKPAIWIAIYASIAKNLWGFLVASFITGMTFGIGCKELIQKFIR